MLQRDPGPETLVRTRKSREFFPCMNTKFLQFTVPLEHINTTLPLGIEHTRRIFLWLFSKNSELYDQGTTTSQTERRTTCRSLTASCRASRGKKKQKRQCTVEYWLLNWSYSMYRWADKLPSKLPSALLLSFNVCSAPRLLANETIGCFS